jgi:hypothetical protein
MKKGNLIFRGNVRLYLEGLGALVVIDRSNMDQITYCVGSLASSILIRDHRPKPINAALNTIDGNETTEFAECFNQPAWSEIRESGNKVEIDLFHADAKGDLPILWMGVIRDGKMPVHSILWEVLRPSEESVTAFAALIED